MTIYNRPDELVFAEQAKPGEVVPFPDILRGWGLTLEQTEGKPPLEWMNAAFMMLSESVRYFMQRGLSEWSDSEDYPSGAFVQHAGKAYRALQASSGVEPGTAAATWAELVPNASTAVRGLVELATATETQDGEDGARAVTPAGLASRTATTGRAGLIEIATAAEAKALTDALLGITPETLGLVLENIMGEGLEFVQKEINIKGSHLSLGVGQTWQDVTAQRANDTTYTNTTGRPIHVVLRLGENSSLRVSQDGTTWANIVGQGSTSGGVNTVTATAVIPAGHRYRTTGYGGWWAELR